MRKLTFLEALKVNEEKPIFRMSEDIKIEYGVNKLKLSPMSILSAMSCEFYAEPEKIEFECEWNLCPENNFYVVPMVNNKHGSQALNHLIGKKTIVTVEVIEE